GDTDVPPTSFPTDGNSLRCTHQRPMQPNGNMPNLRQAEYAAVQHRAAAMLRIGEGMVVGVPVEAGIAWLFTGFETAEENLKCPLHARVDVLQDLRADLSVFGACHLQVRQFCRLLVVGHGDAALLPR